jgi:hypothetical protein
MPGTNNAATGKAGEHALMVILTRAAENGAPVFRAALMEANWPTTDVYVEVLTNSFPRPHFFIQVKTTEEDFLGNPKRLPVKLKRKDESRLLHIPAPTYVVGLKPGKGLLNYHGYIRSVHKRAKHAIAHVSARNNLTTRNLLRLPDEVLAFWNASGEKPDQSAFGA